MIETKASVFIIESNDWEDEREDRREGLVLREILSLSQKPVEYRYVRTRKELVAVLEQFTQSCFRYLHIACHGDEKGFAFTLDAISFQEFIDIASPHLKNRRLFISACGCVKQALAVPILRDTNCYSVIGPRGNIFFSDAAIIWASFYSLMFKRNRKVMTAAEIKDGLSDICLLFGVRFNAYFRRKRPPYYNFNILGPKRMATAVNTAQK